MMPLKDQEDTIKVALTYSTILNKAIGSVDEKVKLELQHLKTDDTFTLLSAFGKNVLPLDAPKVGGEELE